MTSLLPPTSRTRDADRSTGSAPPAPRPLALVATLGGLLAAAGPLVVMLGVGVVGWFLTDGGSHGEPRDGLRLGALGWLVGHGSGVVVDGVAVTAVPLGVTLACAWTTWRVAVHVGHLVAGHGPDAAELGDGGRDWTVPVATALFAAGYVLVTVLTVTLAATPATDPSTPRAVGFAVLLCLLVAGPAVAVGSGRMATWAALVPLGARAAVRAARSMLVVWLVVCTVALTAAFVVDLDTAANIMGQLGAGGGDLAVFGLLTLLVVPNAAAFAGSYLLGPGFAVGVGTAVTPQVAVVGALPLFPLLAALPADGAAPGWLAWAAAAVPVLVAIVVVVQAQRRVPTLRWDEGLLRGAGGGVLCGIGFACLAAVAGGAVGPGRMSQVGPSALDVLVHGVTAFGIGGLVGAAGITWWQRRRHLAPAE